MESNESSISKKIKIKNLENKDDSETKSSKTGAIILGVSGIFAVLAGVTTAHLTKKKNENLLKELGKAKPQVLLENPHSLALKALAWGTVWAVGSVSLITFGVWKLFGFKDITDFKTRLRNQVKKSSIISSSTDQRTEFENLADLFNYLNELDAQKKAKEK